MVKWICRRHSTLRHRLNAGLSSGGANEFSRRLLAWTEDANVAATPEDEATNVATIMGIVVAVDLTSLKELALPMRSLISFKLPVVNEVFPCVR